jgi:DtxR family Mn-dependent transcriptional regulator
MPAGNTARDREQSVAVENFLKAVFTLQSALPEGENVSTNALAEALGIVAPSVTDMARRMASAGYVNYERYYGLRLTEAGVAIALSVIRRHRLIELYLVRELGYALHEVHDEAENLEHAVSDRFVESIAEKLGHPRIDPHGDPIPLPDGTIHERPLISLAKLPLNTSATISRFTAENNEMLQHILDRGFRLDDQVCVVARDPFDGPVTACIDGYDRVIGHQVAESIMVEVEDAPTRTITGDYDGR